MFNNIRFKHLTVIIPILLALIWPYNGLRADFNANTGSDPITRINPKLANYYLKWTIEDGEVNDLAKWDLLILDMETQENSRANLKKIRTLNPKIKILAYITSQEVIGDINNYQWQQYAFLRKKLVSQIDPSWWLKDSSGNRISFWSGTYMLNSSDVCPNGSNGQKWNYFLAQFVADNIYSTGLWDGILYDNIWGDVNWVKPNQIDINNNGQVEDQATVDNHWIAGVRNLLARTRQLTSPNFLILGNGRTFAGYQNYLNGIMLETFPSSWENGGTWSGSMSSYARFDPLHPDPKASVINSGSTSRSNYRQMRYGLTSDLLLNNGYFSFDFGTTDHTQLWWYDEYNINLGDPVTTPYNVLAPNNFDWQAGVWRRDFNNGVVLVNSTNKTQKYLFAPEEMEKIRGTQDTDTNNGTVVNFVQLNSKDGIILLKRATSVKNNFFYNGSFIRVFKGDGSKDRNGFFAYRPDLPGNAPVFITDINNDSQEETLVGASGIISIYRQGQKINSFTPYPNYKGPISIALGDVNGDGQFEIIAAPTGNGGPQISVWTNTGKKISSFFAYDSKNRSGVNVAVGDVNGDGKQEIITAPGSKVKPEIKIFSADGKLINTWLAYDAKFKGGVSVAAGDVNGDGQIEVVTGPLSGGGPDIRIFNGVGKLQNRFSAFDPKNHAGVKVLTEDLNKTGQAQILVATTNF